MSKQITVTLPESDTPPGTLTRRAVDWKRNGVATVFVFEGRLELDFHDNESSRTTFALKPNVAEELALALLAAAQEVKGREV